MVINNSINNNNNDKEKDNNSLLNMSVRSIKKVSFKDILT